MKNKLKAFSLIELSIVILIIGVLIAGVTQASRLVKQSKLTTARTLTQSAPVAGIRGLLLWLETTQEKSFRPSETDDKDQLTAWYDSNPQLTNANTFSTTASANITYLANSAINSLPAVLYSAAATTGSAFSGTVISAPYNSYTIFYVARSTNLAAANTIFYNGVAGTNGFGVSLTSAGLNSFSYSAATAVNGTATSTANQATADIYCITTAPQSVDGVIVAEPVIQSFKNGVIDINSTTTTASWVVPTGNFFIGNSSATGAADEFVGEIAEIIMFDSVLSKSDRQEVERYLSRKFAINIVQN
jgi:prepilin-type N-terminal cleavage/methylation domain-containing protein